MIKDIAVAVKVVEVEVNFNLVHRYFLSVKTSGNFKCVLLEVHIVAIRLD